MRRAAAAALVALLLPASASAHVTVLPERPKLNAQQEFIVRVPNERKVATTKILAIFPKDLVAGQVAAIPGWKAVGILFGDVRAPQRGVEWSGGRIEPGEYMDFRFLARPRKAGQAVFRVDQTYADGKTQRWSGPPEKPGAAEKETGLDEPGPSPAVDVTATPDIPSGTATTKRTSSDAAIWLGVIAIVIALGAALAAGFLWSTRPATLPPDEPDEPA